MHPFNFQVVSSWYHSYGALRAMRDRLFEQPRPSLDDTSWQGLSCLVDQALETLSQETQASIPSSPH